MGRGGGEKDRELWERTVGEEEEKGEGIAGDGSSRLSPLKFMTFDLIKKQLYGVQREPGNQG